MWSDLEEYRQLVQDYEQALQDFARGEAAYREAAKKGPSGTLAEQYDRLAAERRELEETHSRLREMRNSLAHARDEVAATALSL